jgi:DNA (cytosine-5)-methyltransferase 1
VSYTNVYAPDYGIPQKRRRLVLLASMYGEINIIPPTHSPENYVTLQDAIGDLPSVKAGEVSSVDPLHRSIKLKEINLKRIRASKPNGTWEDWEDDLKLACHKKKTGRTYKAVYGRMSWEEPASTITTQFHNYGTGRFGHPEQDRALTLREGALLQTFPPDYKFFEDESKVFIRKFGVHIGNAVPVDLGTVIGESIKAHIGEYHDTEE